MANSGVQLRKDRLSQKCNADFSLHPRRRELYLANQYQALAINCSFPLKLLLPDQQAVTRRTWIANGFVCHWNIYALSVYRFSLCVTPWILPAVFASGNSCPRDYLLQHRPTLQLCSLYFHNTFKLCIQYQVCPFWLHWPGLWKTHVLDDQV